MGARWTPDELAALRRYAAERHTTEQIAHALCRSVESIKRAAYDHRISLDARQRPAGVEAHGGPLALLEAFVLQLWRDAQRDTEAAQWLAELQEAARGKA